MKVLVLGANGMIGHVMFRVLSQHQDWVVFGTERTRDLVLVEAVSSEGVRGWGSA